MNFNNKSFSINKVNFYLLSILLALVFLGVYLCFVEKYGWDWDTYATINTFLNIKNNGFYSQSRGAGYLVPEIGLGFLLYNFGSLLTNIICFFFLVASTYFLYFAFNKNLNSSKIKFKTEEFLLFVILCLSNHILISYATIPIDYTWSLFFYSVGVYLLSNNKNQVSILFLALSFGSRFNFIVFIIPTILFFENSNLTINKKLVILFNVIFFGCLFFVPAWIANKFSLNFIFSKEWYDNFKPDPIFSLAEIGRFLNKTFETIGIIFLFSLLFFFIFEINKINTLKIIIKKFKLEFLIIFINLFVFFLFPWRAAHLFMMIFFLNLVLVKFFKKKIIYFLIALNIFNLFYEFRFIEIKYVHDKSSCLNSVLGARLSPGFKNGFILRIPDKVKETKCYPDLLGKNTEVFKYKDKILIGAKMR